MNKVCYVVAVFVVAVHMVSGCCLHQAHANDSQIVFSPPIDTTCTCKHSGHQHEHQPGEHNSNRRGCGENRCTFTRPDSSNADDLLNAIHCLPPILCLPPPPPRNLASMADLALSHFDASIPLYLQNQILLL